MGKSKTLDFSEFIAAYDLKVGRCRQQIEIMKVCEYGRSRSFLYHIRGLSKKFVEFVNKNKTTIPITFKFVYN